MNMAVAERIQQFSGLGELVCARLKMEAVKLGLEDDVIEPLMEMADYVLSHDRVEGKDSLVGTWRDVKGNKLGEILFHADGSFYAEYDVICNHPTDKRWFVEAVTAWGRGSNIRSEARLLPLPGQV
jgi:hypothetical protein